MPPIGLDAGKATGVTKEDCRVKIAELKALGVNRRTEARGLASAIYNLRSANDFLHLCRHNCQERPRISGDHQQNQQRSEAEEIEDSPGLLNHTECDLGHTKTSRERATWEDEGSNHSSMLDAGKYH
jgi:hypothetical protein